MGSTVTITVTGSIPATGVLFVNVHLDYGLKTMFFAMNTHNDATDPTSTSGAVLIPQGASYAFTASVSGQTTSQTVTSTNRFVQDPGIAGVVTDLNGNPRPNLLVQLFDSNHNLVGMTFTDQDGFFSFTINLTNNRPTTFTLTVSLPNGSTFSQDVVARKNKPVAALLAF